MQAPVLLLIAALAQVDLSFIPAPTSRLLHFHSSAPFFTDALRYKHQCTNMSWMPPPSSSTSEHLCTYLLSYLKRQIPAASLWCGYWGKQKWDMCWLHKECMITMRFSTSIVWFFVLPPGLTVRDGFQPLPLTPQDQIKGKQLFGTKDRASIVLI